jgi:hypothetical protein
MKELVVGSKGRGWVGPIFGLVFVAREKSDICREQQKEEEGSCRSRLSEQSIDWSRDDINGAK